MSAITISAIFFGVCIFFGAYVVEAVKFVKELNKEDNKEDVK